MKSNDTKRIISEIAQEEGISDWAVELIVKSQFEGAYDIIRASVPDKPETFKSVRLNAFCHFKVMPGAFRYFKGREHYEQEKRKRYDAKK